jgi:hypothetical protein
MTADHQRDFDRVLTRSIQERVSSGSKVRPSEQELLEQRAELEEWIEEQAGNEQAGTFDWELGRRINAAKRRFSADSLASGLHNPTWCRDRACRAETCIEARRMPRPSVSQAGPTGNGNGNGPATVRAHRIDPAAVWASHDETPRRWWRSGDR